MRLDRNSNVNQLDPAVHRDIKKVEKCVQKHRVLYDISIAAITITFFVLGVLTLTGLDPRIIGVASLAVGALCGIVYIASWVYCYKGNIDQKEIACRFQCVLAITAVAALCLGAYTFSGQLNPQVLGYMNTIFWGLSVIPTIYNSFASIYNNRLDLAHI